MILRTNQTNSIGNAMFKFSTKLHVHKSRLKKNGHQALYLQIYISTPGNSSRTYIPLNLEWPANLIDLEESILLPRHKKDPDANDYNMMTMSERAKLNEIAKLYRLSGRYLSVDVVKRELFYFDPAKSVIGYFKNRRKELFKLKAISEQTWKNYGSRIIALEKFESGLRWDSGGRKIYRFPPLQPDLHSTHHYIDARVRGSFISHPNRYLPISGIKPHVPRPQYF